MREPYQYCPICGTVLALGIVEGKERKFCLNCNFIDYKNPLPVAVAITVKGKKFLLIKRGLAPRKGTWGSPSGFIEVGETPEEARKALNEAVHLFLITAADMGTLKEVLEEAGYEFKEGSWVSPAWVATEKHSIAVGA